MEKSLIHGKPGIFPTICVTGGTDLNFSFKLLPEHQVLIQALKKKL